MINHIRNTPRFTVSMTQCISFWVLFYKISVFIIFKKHKMSIDYYIYLYSTMIYYSPKYTNWLEDSKSTKYRKENIPHQTKNQPRFIIPGKTKPINCSFIFHYWPKQPRSDPWFQKWQLFRSISQSRICRKSISTASTSKAWLLWKQYPDYLNSSPFHLLEESLTTTMAYSTVIIFAMSTRSFLEVWIRYW